MSSIISRYLIVVVLLVVVIFQLFLYQESLEREKFLQYQISNLQRQVVGLERELVVVKTLVVELDESSLDSMAEDANEAIVTGWEALMETMSRELESARKSLEPDDKPKSQAPQPSPSAGQIPI